jgi:hypothetical protein
MFHFFFLKLFGEFLLIEVDKVINLSYNIRLYVFWRD